MTTARFNLHATAIVIGRTGLLFMGPSGWGKSMLAFTCITEAQRVGLVAMLVADDQVFISREGDKVIAECPETIGGMIELRGTGIVSIPHAGRAVMHYAIIPGSASGPERLPVKGERVELGNAVELPAIRLLPNTSVPLAVLMARAPEIGR
ncbi:serine/threonine protein kinase [Rhizobium sp. S152]|uniref:HPr kinase/phosphorylase n=1 Tax=Rhizobium sp. S152 TaxID=3055038 RepID=UPI0025A94FF1|nr:serine/threonine protein kinase [Rhizobium sp. S152]MDM9624523.1 serine/threonine protein kinase [Rhizobium sp. S152]